MEWLWINAQGQKVSQMIIQCLILSLVFAHQIPFVLPKKRILVIGAGAGGSSFVYSLRNDPRLDVTVYEQSSSIGGRAKVTEFGNLTIELVSDD